MAPPYHGFSTSYYQKIIDAQKKLAKEIPELDTAITEGIIQFASDMLKYTGANLPSSLVVFAAVVLPHSFKNLTHKIRFINHLDMMLVFGKCVFHGRCFYFGLPICSWCEKNVSWYPPGYNVPYEVIPDVPHGWGDDDANVEEP